MFFVNLENILINMILVHVEGINIILYHIETIQIRNPG